MGFYRIDRILQDFTGLGFYRIDRILQDFTGLGFYRMDRIFQDFTGFRGLQDRQDLFFKLFKLFKTMIEDALTQEIIAAAYQVHKILGGGFLEKVYENAMVVELGKRDILVQQQYPIEVFYEGQRVGQYYADLWVDNQVVVELKALENLSKEHEVQLVHYLSATGVEIGLLINFGSSVTIKRKYRTYRPPTQ